mmetsp:Transcript_29277/g.85132  ORF Transcript_29277/g.85132 Transcript_29277/m.85132 type:complete len:498 (+) Transcript_29277:242-1735(+)
MEQSIESEAAYAPAPADSGEEEFVVDDRSLSNSPSPRRSALGNFLLASSLFSVNHGCVTACLNLATARLGDVGAKQSSVLYLSYAASALLGSTWIVKRIGGRNGLALGLSIYCVYVGAFVAATLLLDHPRWAEAVALFGAAVGGLGGGILWTAQGTFFARSAEMHAGGGTTPLTDATADLGAYFAAIYLLGEVALNMLSSFLVEEFELSWLKVFMVYFAIAVVSACGMVLVYEYPPSPDTSSSASNSVDAPNKATAAWRLLRNDPKMICMLPFNFAFGFAASFRGSFISREVVRIALDDKESAYIGVLSSVTAIVAAVMSLFFGRIAHKVGKGTILFIGALCFFLVAAPFALKPKISQWGWVGVCSVYILQGIGRSTYEGTLKAEFADFFAYEKEGAFANIVLMNGVSSALGYHLSINLPCTTPSKYCIEYSDGTLHNVLVFEILVMSTAILAIWGYWRAAVSFKHEIERGGTARVMGTEEEERPFTNSSYREEALT